MLPWALLGLTIFFLLVTYIIVQGSRAAAAWRTLTPEVLVPHRVGRAHGASGVTRRRLDPD